MINFFFLNLILEQVDGMEGGVIDINLDLYKSSENENEFFLGWGKLFMIDNTINFSFLREFNIERSWWNVNWRGLE